MPFGSLVQVASFCSLRLHSPCLSRCHLAMGGGTMAGGWRTIKTMGQRITKLIRFGGFSAETTGPITIVANAIFGIPVSTTHTITGAIVGVGATGRLTAVRWGITRQIVWAWILTIPGAALFWCDSFQSVNPRFSIGLAPTVSYGFRKTSWGSPRFFAT